VLVLSEIASLLGKPLAPIIPPFGAGLAMRALRPLGVNVPPEMLAQLRFGRGVDNRKLKAAGAPLRHTTRETVQAFAEHLRVAAVKGDGAAPYRYEREVEEFLRYSPSVRRENDAPAKLQN
jgi:UDP-glucose 4-epimerase